MAEMTELPKADIAVGGDTACPAFAIGQSLAAPLLYRRCDPAELPFAVCSELEEAPGLIGQERAVEAVQFAMRMRRKGYNVYALGPTGTGRHSAGRRSAARQGGDRADAPGLVLRQQLRRSAATPSPAAAAGPRRRIRRRDEAAGRGACAPPCRRPSSATNTARAARSSTSSSNSAATQAFGALQQRAEAKDITLLRTPMGLALAPKRDGKVLKPEMFEALPATEREQVQHDIEGIQSELEAIMRQVPQWEREHRDAVRDLNRETTGFAIAHLMDELRAGYRRFARGR